VGWKKSRQGFVSPVAFDTLGDDPLTPEVFSRSVETLLLRADVGVPATDQRAGGPAPALNIEVVGSCRGLPFPSRSSCAAC